MRIGFALLTLFPGRVGGSETYALNLLREFARGSGPEHVVVLANRQVMSAYSSKLDDRVKLHHVRSYRSGDRVPTRALAMAWARAAPRRTARDVPAGLEVIHYPVTVPIPAANAPTVVTIHDLQHRDLPKFFSVGERAFRRWAYDGAARGADLVVAISQYTRSRLVETLGLDPERVEVVHHGIDHRRFHPIAPGDQDGGFAIELPERFVLYPANMWPHKNHTRLIEALARVTEPGVELILTGQEYGQLEGLMDRARRLGAADRLRHLGHVGVEVLAALYRRATAVIFPSLYEGFGAPVLEAMASGTPVAAAERTALPEVCADAALFFDPDSTDSVAAAIERITSDEELRTRLRQTGLKRASHFTWETTAATHRAIYERVAATSGSR